VKAFDLQLFAEERREKPTPRRRQEARKRGQVARSVEVNSALILLATFFFLKYFSSWAGLKLLAFTDQYFSQPWFQDWNEAVLTEMILLVSPVLFQLCLPVMGVAMLAGFFANYLQVGVLFSTYPLQPRLDRINPVEGFKRIFSRRALVELLKSLLKVIIVGYLAYVTIRANLGLFPRLLDMDLVDAVGSIGELCSTLVLRIGLLLLLLAVFDYAFQYWEHEKSLRMTRQELKEEYRHYEGDPQVRARIRQRQRQIALRRMMQEVPKADVVITNPVHYAVALRYVPEEMSAPVVLAKGVDHLALRIRAIAQEHGILIYEDPPLAQTLYWSVEVGDMIPVELYEAVARVLAFVYRLRPGYSRRMKGGR